jgi:hypothetical protein
MTLDGYCTLEELVKPMQHMADLHDRCVAAAAAATSASLTAVLQVAAASICMLLRQYALCQALNVRVVIRSSRLQSSSCPASSCCAHTHATLPRCTQLPAHTKQKLPCHSHAPHCLSCTGFGGVWCTALAPGRLSSYRTLMCGA